MNADDARDSRADVREERRWANYFEVGYNAYEVVLRFGQFYAHNGEVHWHTRIVTHPAYARELLRTLRDSIDEHERAFPAGKGGQMPNEVQYKVTLAVKDGPKLELSETLMVHAYDKVEFELRSNQRQPVDLQPTGTSRQLHFLLIQAKPDPKSDPTDRGSVWYSVDGGAQVQLASNHALLGKGVLELLAKPPRMLDFHNRRSTPVTITCLVGRDNAKQNGDTTGGGTTTGYPGDTGTTPPGGGTTPTYPGGTTPTYPGGGGTTPTYPGGGGTTPTPTPTYPGGGGGTPTYPGGGGGGGTPTYPGGGGTPTYPGGGGGTPTYPGGGTPPYPGGGGGGGGTEYPGGGGGGTEYPGGGTPEYPGGGGGTPPYPGGGGTTPTYPPGGGGGTSPGYPGRGGETPPTTPGRPSRPR